jgi:four helix bundle protein
MRLTDSLPPSRSVDVLAKQLLRSATSVAANYRAACRARTASEFQAKLGIVEEEGDESQFWMELLVESGKVKPKLVENLLKECSEIVAMVVASIRTSRQSKVKREFPQRGSSNPQSAIRNPQ